MDAATISYDPQQALLRCDGCWTTGSIAQLQLTMADITAKAVVVNGDDITHMDSAGAWALQKFISRLHDRAITTELTGFTTAQSALIQLVSAAISTVILPSKPEKKFNPLYYIGQETIGKLEQIKGFAAFIGEAAVHVGYSLLHPSRVPWKSVLVAVDDAGFRALPIIALLSFLIGVVLTYQMGLQLEVYGANIYIVDVTGIAILREFGPLITAIIAAGRTSSALTAQIGTMKVNEEIDALYTIGVSPIERLALPKILGVLIALPLLVVWADVFGVLGSMVMSSGLLGINYHVFLQRFQQVVTLSDYLIGIGKTPVFALIIAAVGCYQGFQVSTSAESVGWKTTKSVVQAIFLIIIADALFSIYFGWQGI